MVESLEGDEYPSLFEVFDACCQGIRDSSIKEIQKYKYIYLLNTASYNYFAPTGEYEKIKNLEIPVFGLDFDEQQLQKDFKNLYKSQLVDGPARKYYDQIKRSQERCPYCQKPRIEELDHFLPQSKYAIFSIFPPNLIPCCRNCNKNKRDKILQLHPCYDHDYIHQCKWLFAEIVDDENGPTFRFYTNPPAELDEVFKNKIKKYFDDLKLGRTYAEDSISELVEAKALSTLNLSLTELKEELKQRFGNYDKEIINHWKRAICECIDQASCKSILRLLKPI